MDCYVMEKTAKIENDEHSSNLIKELDNRQSHPCLYNVPLLFYQLKKENSYCSKSENILTYTPFPEEDLSKDIADRKASKRPFSNHELTTLLYDLVGAGYHLQKLGYAHTALSPDWVALTTTGYALLDDPLINRERVLNIENMTHLYLSPEAYKTCKQKQGHASNFCGVKADVFSMGLIILEAGLLRSCSQHYKDRRGEKIDGEALHSNIKEFEYRYNSNNLLKTTVRRMLSVDPEFRPDFKELKARLPDYKIVKEYFEKTPDFLPFTKTKGDQSNLLVSPPLKKHSKNLEFEDSRRMAPREVKGSIRLLNEQGKGDTTNMRERQRDRASSQPSYQLLKQHQQGLNKISLLNGAQNGRDQAFLDAFQEGDQECPLDHPKNPYYKEYMQLRQKAYGKFNSKTGLFTPNTQKPHGYAPLKSSEANSRMLYVHQQRQVLPAPIKVNRSQYVTNYSQI